MWMVSEGFLESMQKAIFPLPSVRANHFMKSEICQAESCHERSAKAAILSEKNWVPTTESRVKLIQCEASLLGESLQDFCGVLSVQKVVEVGRCGGSTCKSLGACTKHIVHIHVAQQIWHMACTASFGHSVTIMAVLTKYLLQASSVGFKYCFKGRQSGTTQLFIGNQWFELGFSGKIHWKPHLLQPISTSWSDSPWGFPSPWCPKMAEIEPRRPELTLPLVRRSNGGNAEGGERSEAAEDVAGLRGLRIWRLGGMGGMVFLGKVRRVQKEVQTVCKVFFFHSGVFGRCDLSTCFFF